MNTIYDGTYTIGQTSATNFVAGPGIKIDEPSAGTVRIGNDETVLFETNTDTSTATLSENVSAFRYADFYITDDNGGVGFIRIATEYGNYKAGCYLPSLSSPDVRFAYVTASNGISWSADGCQKVGSSWMNIGTGPIRIKKVVGINRIGGNE